MKNVCQNSEETKAFAAQVAKTAKPGDIFALFGDLGSGKTTFSQGFIASFGVSKTVTSPTFVIMKKYAVEGDRVREIVHLDCYRFQSEKDALAIGLDEFFERKDIIALVEWPERIWPLISDKARRLEFKYITENERLIELQ